jgi:hypothetical protein
MRTDGYQTTLGLANQMCCQCPGQYALMFSFGKVGDCVRVSCDNFVNCVPANLYCFTPATCCVACKSLPAPTHCTFGTCFEDYFQGHGQGTNPCCLFNAATGSYDTGCAKCNILPQTAAVSYTLIYKNSANTADSKAFLAGWRSYAMLYGGVVGPQGCQESCAMVGSRTNPSLLYNCHTLGATARGETTPYGCGYFRNSPGLNVWCYGSQANNTMIGSEIVCDAIGGSTSSWTNFSFANVRMIGNKLVISGTMGPRIALCCIFAASNYTGSCYLGVGIDTTAAMSGEHGCQSSLSQTGHVTVFNADGVVGTTVCCLDIFHSSPFYPYEGPITCLVACCSYCAGRECCGPAQCQGYGFGGLWWYGSQPNISDTAGLKTLNVYGSANSILSFPIVPNVAVMNKIAPQCESPTWCCCGAYPLCTSSCFDSPTSSCCASLNSPFRSDQSLWCAFSYDTCNELYCTSSSCRIMPCCCALSHFCNPGSNVIVTHFQTHIYNYSSGISPGTHNAIYTAPTANQDMTAYNFCYIISPNMDWCIWNAGWACLNCGCELTCPACNIVCCTACSVLVCAMNRATFPRAQQMYHDNSNYPCCSTPARVCCSAIGGCGGIGNHHLVVAQANNTWQCSSAICVTSMMNTCQSACCHPCCYCNTYSTWWHITTPPVWKTCNQSGGGNCMWYDFIPQVANHNTSYLPGMMDQSGCTWFNSQFMGQYQLNISCSTLLSLGLPATDDNKRTGYTCIYWGSLCCAFCVDSQVFPIRFSRMTRGSGGVSNVSNSIHVAYFDLVPYRCTISGGNGFYANGNSCPGPSGLTCCLMYVKSDIFYNTFA